MRQTPSQIRGFEMKRTAGNEPRGSGSILDDGKIIFQKIPSKRKTQRTQSPSGLEGFQL